MLWQYVIPKCSFILQQSFNFWLAGYKYDIIYFFHTWQKAIQVFCDAPIFSCMTLKLKEMHSTCLLWTVWLYPIHFPWVIYLYQSRHNTCTGLSIKLSCIPVLYSIFIQKMQYNVLLYHSLILPTKKKNCLSYKIITKLLAYEYCW